jgi:hypothetical protein
LITSPSQQAIAKQEEAARKAADITPTDVTTKSDVTPKTVDHVVTSEAQQAAEKQGN